MGSRRRAVRGVAVALLAAGLTASCGYQPPAEDPSTLMIGALAEPTTLDFTRSPAASIPEMLLYNVFETLVQLDDRGQIVPGLATSWTVSPSGLDYEFHLRASTFSTGRAVTARDVVFSLDRARGPKSTHPFGSNLAAIERVSAPDARTVRLHLSRPSNNLLFWLAGTVGAVLDHTTVDRLATAPVGSGPWVVSSWRRGDRITLTRRTDVDLARPAAAPATVVFRFFVDPTTLNNAMLADDLDVIRNVQAPQSLSQFDDPRFRVTDGTTTGEVVLSMNTDRPPLDDVRVRRAIRMALDKRVIRDLAWSGYGHLIGSMVPPSDPWYEDLTAIDAYDPAGAKRLLAEAGVTDLKLALRPANLPYAVAAAQIVAAQLSKVGIAVTIEPMEFPAAWVSTVLTHHDFDLSIVSHVEPRDLVRFGEPDYYFTTDDATVRRLLAQADAGPPAGQVAAMRAAARRISEHADADWLWLMPNLTVSRVGVSGLPVNQVSQSLNLAHVTKRVDAPAGER